MWYTGTVSKPWEITGDDLEAWARRVDAPALLPKLIRRLLAATTSLDDLEMRADAGTRLGGWDGLVRARDGSRFCPPGVSVWELSVDQKVKTKLGEDFEKRTQSPPPPIRPQLCTYVAVTAHRAPWKASLLTGFEAARQPARLDA